MPSHRDDSKAEFNEGRTGRDEHGAHPTSTTASPGGGHPRSGVREDTDPPNKDRYGLTPVPDDTSVPAEEATFGQSGGVGSQPGLGKRLATDEEEDLGHLSRDTLGGDQPSGSIRDRGRGAGNAGAEPPSE